jgi:molybdopterin molybdotransferase
MISLQAARAQIEDAVRPLDPTAMPLAEAHGRILREPVAAAEDQPAFDRSAMDGYAVNAADRSARFRLVGEIQPGVEPSIEIGSGECARIFTGAQIPRGASQVIMQEDVAREGEWIIPRKRNARTWIRTRGEDARRGDVLLSPGQRLHAGSLSLLAQLGAIQPMVSPRPRAIHFTTGNELVDPDKSPAQGQIRDSNSSLMSALLAESGARLAHQGRCRDSLDLLVDTISARPSADWDLLLISGGASVGDYDFGTRALERLGFTTHFQKINLRPGKPLVFATRSAQAAFVIPGNPLSHFVTFHTAIRLAIECMEGSAPRWPIVQAELTEPLPTMPDARETWWPARVNANADRASLLARPLVWQSSGDLRVLSATNALLRIAPGAGPFEPGARIDCLLLDLPG